MIELSDKARTTLLSAVVLAVVGGSNGGQFAWRSQVDEMTETARREKDEVIRAATDTCWEEAEDAEIRFAATVAKIVDRWEDAIEQRALIQAKLAACRGTQNGG